MTAPAAPELSHKRRIGALDGIRAIAVALVVVYHMHLGVSGGLIGVDVFFVLSGYLITTLLLREIDRAGSIRFGQFYLRRLIRLMPPLVVMVVVVTVTVLATSTEEARFGWAVFGALSYLTPVTREFLHPDAIFDHTWTLGYEEYFYLVWPTLLVIFTSFLQKSRRWLGFVLGLGAALGYGAYWVLDALGHEFSFLRVAGIAAGASMALIWRPSHPRRAVAWFVALLGVASLTASVLSGRYGPLLPLTVALSAFSALLFVWTSVTHEPTWLDAALSWRPLRSLGTVSYEIYLWQTPVLLLADRLGIPRVLGRGPTDLVCVALILAFAYGSHASLGPLQAHWRAAAARNPSTRTATRSPSLSRRPAAPYPADNAPEDQ